MPKKVNTTEILADILNAMFSGEKIIVETTGVRFFKFYKVFEKEPQILAKEGSGHSGLERSENVGAAKSIKVGHDIVIKRKGKNFIVRALRGEVLLPNSLNTDMGYIWVALGSVYQNGEKDMMRVAGNLTRQLRETDLRAICHNVALHGADMKEKPNKYEQAIEQLKEMGIQPKRLMAYIQKKQKEND